MNKNKKYAIWIPVLLALLVLGYVVSGKSLGSKLDFGEDALIVSIGSFSYELPYENIAELTLEQAWAPGQALDGETQGTLFYGTWNTDSFGPCTLCATRKADSIILVRRTDGGLFAFNEQDTVTTNTMYNMFRQLLEHR